MKKRIPFLVLFLAYLAPTFAQNSKTLTIEGKAFRPKDTLLLIKSHEDLRYQGVKIPMNTDGSFYYEFEIDAIEEYQLVFNSEHQQGAWKPIDFFSDSDYIFFELYPAEKFEENKIKGSELTKQKKQFNEVQYASFAEEIEPLYDQLWDPLNDKAVKEKIQAQIDTKLREMIKWQHDYFKKTPSLVGFYAYFDLLRQADQRGFKTEDLEEFHKFWISRYPDHPLSEIAQHMMSSKYQLKEGGQFVDLNLPKEQREGVKLSALIKENKYTLLDLWAPWCGPCIKKSLTIKENYQAIQKQGIEVVAVIGGISEYSQFERASQKYNYPWKVFPEVNDENKVWEKYGISNAGGRQFLFNAKGKLIAVNPKLDFLLALDKE